MEWNLCMGSSPRSSQGILILLSSGESGARGAALSVCVLRRLHATLLLGPSDMCGAQSLPDLQPLPIMIGTHLSIPLWHPTL